MRKLGLMSVESNVTLTAPPSLKSAVLFLNDDERMTTFCWVTASMAPPKPASESSNLHKRS